MQLPSICNVSLCWGDPTCWGGPVTRAGRQVRQSCRPDRPVPASLGINTGAPSPGRREESREPGPGGPAGPLLGRDCSGPLGVVASGD